MAGKAWNALSPAYRARLERHGYTAADHAAGKSKTVARGHGNDKAYRAIRKQVGGSFVTDTKLTAKQKREAAENMVSEKMRKIDGHHFVPGFDKMSLSEKIKWERNFRLGFMTPGTMDDERKEARNIFLGELKSLEVPGLEMDWVQFRDDYQSMFGSGIR